MDHPTAADTATATPRTLPRRSRPPAPSPGRFSPLSAPERETLDAFCAENRAWALRQARRSYRHLPETLREQAVERALTEMRTRAPQSLERRALSAELAERLTEALRHVHVGWCLNESSALLRREGTEPVQPEVRREGLAHFVDEGLGGMERAVLQLEIGAGRDTRAARAALRLGPRQYAAHREAGLSKLRDAISAQVIGRACDQHVAGIIDAATGDREAMDRLAGGPQRCRYCAREAQGLRSVLHERLAVAPWPLAIKPAGLLAAKLGAVGAALGGGGGKAAGTGGAGLVGAAGGSGAGAAATVLAVAALATGTAAVVDGGANERSREAAPTAAESSNRADGTRSASAARRDRARRARTRAAKPERAGRGARLRPSDRTGGGSSGGGGSATPPSSAAPAAPSAPSTTATAPSAGSGGSSGPVTTATKPVTEAVDDATQQATGALPPTVAAPVDQTVDDVTDTADDVGATVDGLLEQP